jgi:transcription initiation factor TFIIIB Brf1 subunit/transcription initiation factor TFIIB
VYRASDRIANEEWLDELEATADELDLRADARSHAVDLFLSAVPEDDRSKRPTMAASLYVGALLASEERSQTRVADAAGVSRLTVQHRWKELVETVGLDAPDW